MIFRRVYDFPIRLRQKINRPLGIVGSHTWLISNNMVNTFRYGFTRQKFEDTGDSTGDNLSFRSVFTPLNFAYPFSRQTDTQNFVNDFSWVKGNHSLQFGGNIRIVRNERSDETSIHDNAVVNRSFFAGSGNVLTNPIVNHKSGYGRQIHDWQRNILSTRDAVAAVLGRYSQYTYNTISDLTVVRLPWVNLSSVNLRRKNMMYMFKMLVLGRT